MLHNMVADFALYSIIIYVRPLHLFLERAGTTDYVLSPEGATFETHSQQIMWKPQLMFPNLKKEVLTDTVTKAQASPPNLPTRYLYTLLAPVPTTAILLNKGKETP